MMVEGSGTLVKTTATKEWSSLLIPGPWSIHTHTPRLSPSQILLYNTETTVVLYIIFCVNVEVCAGSSEKSEAVEAMVRAGIPAHVVQRASDVIATIR